LRPPEEVSLRALHGDPPAAGLADERQHLRGLDALGDHERLDLARKRHDGDEHRPSRPVLEGRGDHLAVDLDEVDREPAQHLEAGVAGAHVVERHLEAELAQSRDLRHDRRDRGSGALGDLHHEPTGVEAYGPRPLPEAVGGPGHLGQRAGREVQEQQRVRRQLAGAP